MKHLIILVSTLVLMNPIIAQPRPLNPPPGEAPPGMMWVFEDGQLALEDLRPPVQQLGRYQLMRIEIPHTLIYETSKDSIHDVTRLDTLTVIFDTAEGILYELYIDSIFYFDMTHERDYSQKRLPFRVIP